MKVNTIEQFKVLEHIKENFVMEEITVEIIDRWTLKATDKEGVSALFVYKDGGMVTVEY